jgi:MoxR-like ATPase
VSNIDFSYLDKIDNAINISSKIIYDKDNQFKIALCSILSGGHLLIIDKPGLGKTTLVKLISKIFEFKMGRVQFTNDLLPTDILGMNVFDKNDSSFKFKKGPIFSELLLADELNRTSPKTQSSMLQAMEEKQVTIDGVTYELGEFHHVFATINPVDYVGTFELPDSQLDRFVVSFDMGSLSREIEKKIISNNIDMNTKLEEIKPVFEKLDITNIKEEIKKIFVSEDILDYSLDILELSRSTINNEGVFSPRSGQHLLKVAKAFAYIQKREFVIPDDINFVSTYVLSHRLGKLGNYPENKLKIKSVIEKVNS